MQYTNIGKIAKNYKLLYQTMALTIVMGWPCVHASSIDPSPQSYYTIDASGTITGTSGTVEYLNTLTVDQYYQQSATVRYGYGVLANANNINLYLNTVPAGQYNINVNMGDATRSLYVYGLQAAAGKNINVQAGSLTVNVQAGIATPATADTSRVYVYGVNADGNFGNNAYINTTAMGSTSRYNGNNFGEIYNYGIYGLSANSSQFGNNTTVNLTNHGSYMNTGPMNAKVVQTQSYAYGITNATLGTNTTVNIFNQDNGSHYARAENDTNPIGTNAYATADARSIGIQASTTGDGLAVNINNQSGTSEAVTNRGLNQSSIAQSNVIVNTAGVLNSNIGNNASIDITNKGGQATAIMVNSGNMPKATASVYTYGIQGNSIAGDNTTINTNSTAGNSITKGLNNPVTTNPADNSSYSYAEVEDYGVALIGATTELARLGNNTSINMIGKGGIAQDYTSMADTAIGTSAAASVYGAATTGNVNSRITFADNTKINVQAIGGTATSNGNNVYAYALAVGAYGNVTFQGSTSISTATVAGSNNGLLSERYGYAVYTADPAHKLYINRADSSTGNNYLANAQVKLNGDIVNYGGEIRITAENPGSYINGTVIQDPGAKVYLDLDKQAQWNLTANTYSNQADGLKPIITLTDAGYLPTIANSIDVYSLNVGNGVQINLTSDNASRTYNSSTDNNYRTLVSTAGNFNITGSGNYFILNTDLSQNIADKITIDSSAPGINYIKVNYDPYVANNIPINTPIKTLVVEAKPGVAAANLQGQFIGVLSETGAYSWVPNVLQDGLNWYITGITQRASSRLMTAADTARILDYMLTNNTEDLTKRLGDLRVGSTAGKDLSGIWARYDHGNEQNSSGRKAELNYNRFTVGYDRAKIIKNGKIYNGISLSQLSGSTTYQSGSGKNSSIMIGLYHTWLGKKGHYYDIVVKTGRISGNYGLLDSLNNYYTANMATWGTTLSGEYGYRKQLKSGLYIEPQIQLILGHTSAHNSTTSTSMNIRTDSSNIATARLGFNIGKQYNDGSIYLRANYYHNMAGNSGVAADGLKYYRADHTINWYELGIGSTWKASKNSNIYIEASKYLGDIKSSLNIQIGARWNL